MKQIQNIAVLMTCHNRKDQTLDCLDKLFKNHVPAGYVLEVFLVDDGSTDGTEEAVCDAYPKVNIIKGDGSLFWNGGMRVAFEAAMKVGFDYYLWLNDDTILMTSALTNMLKTEAAMEILSEKGCIVVGNTCDSKKEKRTYGGVVFQQKKAFKFIPVQCSDKPQACDALEGNFVLIPARVAESIGNLSAEYTHAMGDMDYGLRAKAKGVAIWTTAGFIGVCDVNPAPSWCDKSVPIRKRVQILLSPKGLPPKEWMVFTRRHAGKFWVFHWAKIPLRAIVPWIWRK